MAADVKATKVRVANPHAGPIMLLRSRGEGQERMALPPLSFEPGQTIEVDAAEWAEHKKSNPVLRDYLDRGLLLEVRKLAQVPVTDVTSTDLAIPEHLQTEEEEQQGVVAKASVRRRKPGTVQV